jgi:hypothetical protein
MVVEPASLCWLSGRLTAEVSGKAWAEQFERFPNLEQVVRDGGTGLAKGVQLLNEERQKEGKACVRDQGDHFHAFRSAGGGLWKSELAVRKALAEAERVQRRLEECERHGQSRSAPASRARGAWYKAEKAMDQWSEYQRLWSHARQAMQLFTPEGELNCRTRAEADLAEALAKLPSDDFAKAKRYLQKPEMLNYLDRAHDKLQALPFPEELKQAAVRREGLRRRPELLEKENRPAAALRGVLLLCTVVLAKAGDLGRQTAEAVRDIFRRAYRASSLIECINSVLRMQQARHRNMTQNLLDLKRLYWNCHRFRSGRRRGTTPYERLGTPLPTGCRWSDLLKLTPEQLREKLSTFSPAA